MQREDINTLIAGMIDTYTGMSLDSFVKIQSVTEESGHWLIKGVWRASLPAVEHDRLTHELSALISQQRGVELSNVRCVFSTSIRSHGVTTGLSPLPGVSNCIAIASGKGGVGKSTTTINMAIALAQQGARVGVLDADIYGPNQPLMCGISESMQTKDNQFQPLSAHGVVTMSVGYLVDEHTPMVWRGPIVSKVLLQLLKDTAWPTLDYLLIDMPPGTGDVQLTLSKSIALTGAVIVSTPQSVALQDAMKAKRMFDKVKVPILGVIENMSTYVCTACGHEEAIFGSEGTSCLLDDASVPLLGQMPLNKTIREAADDGVPMVVQSRDSLLSQRYHRMASIMTVQVAKQPRQYSGHFSNIAVE